MRISDWSSDVCSSDLVVGHVVDGLVERPRVPAPVAVAAQEGDRLVQRDAVHPGGERAGRIVARPGAPELHGDTPGQDAAVLGRARVSVGQLADPTTSGEGKEVE